MSFLAILQWSAALDHKTNLGVSKLVEECREKRKKPDCTKDFKARRNISIIYDFCCG
jgi:hypothetical protein